MRTRIFRAPGTHYYGEDVLDAPTVYTDSHFHDLVANGFNAVWLRARLRQVARTKVFPELASDAPRLQECLNGLCERAGRHGVRVFLYLNEPLCFPADHPFWQAHPEVKGVPGKSSGDGWDDTRAICTSHPHAIAFLREATADLFSSCPKLGGVFLITRSEHHTHCYSHTDAPDCPRCAQRPVAEVVAEVVNTIAGGIHSASPEAEVIAWNWSWPADHELEILSALDPRVILMVDFERGGWKTILGQRRFIDEYSLSYPGPSEQFVRLHDAARRERREVYAKLQVGTTHEIATVNNLPLIPNLLKKARWLTAHNVPGTLATWNFGNRLSLNTYAFNRFLTDLAGSDDDGSLAEVGRDYFGVDSADEVVRAWREFTEAFDHYPFRIKFLYFGPTNYAPAYPLPRPGDPDRPMQPTWVPLEKPYGTRLTDALDVKCRDDDTPFTLEDVRLSFGKMAELFAPGVDRYTAALAGARSPNAARELKNARVILHILRSVHNIFDAYLAARSEPFDENAWREIARREIDNLQGVLPLLRGETEIGYHIEAADWYFTEEDVRAKLADLKRQVG